MNVVELFSSGRRRLEAIFRFWRASRRGARPEPVLRTGLFNAEQMEAHGIRLALSHRLGDPRRAARLPDHLLPRLDENQAVLTDCCRMFSRVVAPGGEDRRIPPAGEWLLDNFYLVEEQIRTARRHLPRDYSRELPRLAGDGDLPREEETADEVGGAQPGIPRVYDLALHNIAHGDGRLDSSMLTRFVAAYQTVSPLTLGELWAIPIMLRLALIENLRRVALRLMAEWKDHNLAARWADRMLETAGGERRSMVLAVARMAEEAPPLTDAFVAEFARRLQGQNAAFALPLTWLEERLAENGRSIDAMIQADARRQAADQVTIGNSITSLRSLSAVDWRAFVENLSVVERILREDPAGVYPAMDFATRDHYRHLVERLARANGQTEEDVARAAVDLARKAAGESSSGQGPAETEGKEDFDSRRIHVGCYLRDDGLSELERMLGGQDIYPLRAGRLLPTAAGRAMGRLLRRHPLPLYLGLILLFTLLFSWPLAHALHTHGRPADWPGGWPWPLLAGAVLLIVTAASQPAVQLVNWLITLLTPPGFVPRMDYRGGLPPGARTMAVVPALVAGPQDVRDLLEKLERHYLANRDPFLQFGLLTDFTDASAETTDADADLLRALAEGVHSLNRRYRRDAADPDPFFVCHRPRRWNESEGAWMGYERKRGKLAEFNALLRGRGRDRFLMLAGDAVENMTGPPVRYVITLDADTLLPRDSARSLAAAMAHPLNRPRFDPQRGRVTSGYGILQPLVGIPLPDADRSPYCRLFCCDAGIDPYTRMVSDVYQDLFREGSFIGKGIYDVDAVEKATGGAFPDNRILSHDLVEGCYARSGLLSDVQLYEGYPSRYVADANRRQRWIRGDWQLLPWLLPRVPRRDGGKGRNPLSALSLWKIADNLRRSLYAPALTGMFLTGWFCLPRPALWTAAILVLAFSLPVLSALYAASRLPADLSFRRHARTVVRSLGRQALREALALSWLPHEAWFSLNAVIRTLWRTGVSHRHLLQWNPSSSAERLSPRTLAGVCRQMWICPVAALAVALPVASNMAALATVLPFSLAWLAAPVLAWGLSRTTERHAWTPEAGQRRFLRLLARRTWAFFERHVGPEDHWLPPDNMQEAPVAAVAHRTSPTNMGLNLLAHLAAHDFGYLDTGRLLERLEACLTAMESLPRHQGHFYNWYDTRTLAPLPPEYVSTVDSGNLAGHLLVLRRGLLELADEPVCDRRQWEGLSDTAALLAETLPPGDRNAPEGKNFLAGLEAAGKTNFPTMEDAANAVRRLAEQAVDLAERMKERSLSEQESERKQNGEEDEAVFWLDALTTHLRNLDEELRSFALPAEICRADSDRARPTWRSLARLDPRLLPENAREKAAELRRKAGERREKILRLARMAEDLADMDFRFLYDSRRDLLSIGYNVRERTADPGFYDLLASEARLTYFVAIARGQIPQESWFRLGRLLAGVNGMPVAMSWSGSMFEYLMPLLVMPDYEGTLLSSSCRGAVARQIAWGREVGLPWGVSESCYNVLDSGYNYQYRAFGVPGLGLRRGLADDLVFAPYACVMALMVAPDAACRNLRIMAAKGLRGRYGMYEAVDHTPARLPRGRKEAVIRAFMAHHQGMSMLSLAYALLGQPMQRRFLAEPRFQATDLLLQERTPGVMPDYLPPAAGAALDPPPARDVDNRLRVCRSPSAPVPSVQLLSNGRYHVMVSSSGAGFSRYQDLAITRWREDPTRDNRGTFCYLRDVASGHYWSAAFQPTCGRTDRFEAIFSDARAEFRVREKGFDCHLEIVVSPEDDMELRRLHLTNRARERRELEATSCAEVVLAPPMADAQHPAFSNLFVQTEIVRPLQALLCTRRPREPEETRWWLCHMLAVHDAEVTALSYETDRARFLGRNRDAARPAAMETEALSDTEGAVLDPVAAIRCRIVLDPGQTAVLDFVTGISRSRGESLEQIEKFRDRRLTDRVFDLAWTHSRVLLHQLNITLGEARLFQQLAASVLYANASLRARGNIIAANSRSQSGLWGQSISGDLPIVLLKIRDAARIDLVSQMVRAHAYWRIKGLLTDLVIWNEERAGYRQQLQDLILDLIPSGAETHLIDRPGGIFVRSEQQLSREERILIQAVARVVISDDHGSLADQLRRLPSSPATTRRIRPGVISGRDEAARTGGLLGDPRAALRSLATGGSSSSDAGARRSAPLSPPSSPETDRDAALPPDLVLTGRHGGFSPDGREYVIVLPEGSSLPAPWVNVMANPQFGTVVSECGTAYTWKENSHEFRLTPWDNDPVLDSGGEALYVRDEESGRYWSPTALPCRGRGGRVIRHGFGYSVFRHSEEDISAELTVFVAADDPVKCSLLRLINHSSRRRRLSVTGYAEWVLGDLRFRNAMHVVTEADPATGALYARNAYSLDFPGRTAFLALAADDAAISGYPAGWDGEDADACSFTCDRREFVGRNGSLRDPAAMTRERLRGSTGPGLDPCAALRRTLALAPGESRDVLVLLGAGDDARHAADLVRRWKSVDAARAGLKAVREHWIDILGKVRVDTPDPTVNIPANGWLLYQVISSRFRARSGYYQSGGAFGFRDQLQDSMAMIHAAPADSRAQLLRCAAHQFPEGDVQHWWHPPLDRGVRTRCSDDYLWLPLATARYVRITGDSAVLDEPVRYIEGRAVSPDEESLYDLPLPSSLTESLYDHCVRAIEHGLPRGGHGLPLMGTGDWNDGMNRVGWHGKGESVWLGFFQYTVLKSFADTARLHGDPDFAARCETEAAKLRESLETHAWDGSWYRRAWFDDGTPLGSAQNGECRIDSLSQSWAVLSGAAPDDRRRQAMEAVNRHLVRRNPGLIQLLDPPFDASPLEPGYIKGYLPGVRENGGQYTHAALWTIMAFAELGDADRAWELLNLIHPLSRSGKENVYKAEPYVVAADVYAVDPHAGRGGWSWYTGAAGWMYRLLLESLLGLTVEGDAVSIRPVTPSAWKEFSLTLRRGTAEWRIRVVLSDEAVDFPPPILLTDDGRKHDVEWLCPRARPQREKTPSDSPGMS